MVVTLPPYQGPLRIDADGVIRVGESRVTLDTVIHAFKRGDSPETIVAQFPAITMIDAYGTVAYYLQHQTEIDAYLQERENQAEQVRREIEAAFNPVGTREKLLARLKEQQQQDQQ
jgi:uncharacterized protein (DUF433 family)